ncbi:MAG: hypothetical protein M3003_10540 [Candidatus Dormibacteraeota bacterium]|nr:hypothetical protein [Candidatus Dormibacteraeota bacterium]
MRSDVEQAKPGQRVSIHGEIAMTEGMTLPGERVVAMSAGVYAGGVLLVVATSQRLYVHRASKRMPVFRAWPLAEVSGVAWKSGFASGTLTFDVDGLTESVGGMPKKDGARVVDALTVASLV